MSSKSKKQPNLSKLLKPFNLSSTKGRLLSFVLIFSLMGGGYMAYQTFAASYPPANLRGQKNIDNVLASDGVKGTVTCVSVTGQTGYGPLANCIQRKPGDPFKIIYRTGYYSPTTKRFSPTGGWLDHAPSSWGSVCKNMDNFFYGNGPLATGYGPVLYGQIYRVVGTSIGAVWQIKWANMSTITGNCSVSGDWMNAKSL